MNYNHKIKTIEFANKTTFRYFTFEEKTGILTIFFSGEVINFGDEIKDQLDQVLSGKRRRIECSGNDCSWRIGKRHTLIVNSFANEGEPSEITVDTAELRRLIDEWDRVRKKFREERGKDNHSSDKRES